MLGTEAVPLARAERAPTVVLLVGLQGSGKTTSAAKLANVLRKQGRRPLLVAADVHRPAAIDQLRTLGKQLGLPVVAVEPGHVSEGVTSAIAEAARTGADTVIVDSAGRLHIDDEMMQEVERIVGVTQPHEVSPSARRPACR
jgi:signal recognition particle subunit SRP54